ncbi:hypothetical protein [Shewanella maritima]|uniref:hypothetical protein n=1 Tax=Shewanella maritima TaxID=2520507 RepID=UPI001F5EDBC4|nr:hypothetical protein [Shewanella maritima]
MDTAEVSRIYDAVRSEWQGPIGIHTHNNMARAIDNTLAAREKGVTWLDVTVTGMGRGAGNAQTETLLAILAKETDTYEPAPVYELAIRHFEPMQRSHGWGSNLLYFLGAQNDIHPTYIQNLLSDTHYGTDEIVGAIDYLSKLENTTSYKGDILAEALSLNSAVESVSGTADLAGLAEDREVLILADGPGLKKYGSQLSVYIKQRNPIVIAINNLSVPSDLVDYYCVTHNTKFLSEKDEYNRITKPVILPKHRFTQEELSAFSSNVKLYDYGLEVNKGEFSAGDSMCVVPYDVTAAYALAIAYTMSANNVSLVGFDGYEAHDPRQLEMLKLWSLVENYAGFCDVVAITPTTYPITQGSIYAPV